MPVKHPGFCADCLQTDTLLIEHSVCVYRYQFPISILVREMKFNGRLNLAKFLGDRIADVLIESGAPLPQAIIPVPLPHGRLVGRGYNQAAVLASSISHRIGVPVDIDICSRRKHSVPQTDLPAAERRQNIKGAFLLSTLSSRHYRHIAIVDDVVTTGSTVAELARIFLRAGTERVDVWACARAII